MWRISGVVKMKRKERMNRKQEDNEARGNHDRKTSKYLELAQTSLSGS